MSENPKPAGEDPPERGEIARRVLSWSVGGIIFLAAVVLIGAAVFNRDKFTETSAQLFNALLPLLGTWVGTVLAFYFSKANFEAASQSVKDMVRLTIQQKLEKYKVENEMIPAGQIKKIQIPAGKTEKDVTIVDLRNLLGGKITRVPVIDDKGVVRYIIHQSMIYKFIADRGIELAEQNKLAEIPKLSLEELVSQADIRTWVTAIAYVSLRASLADAKAAMELKSNCQDVVITQNGRPDEPILGWLTNVDIGRLAEA